MDVFSLIKIAEDDNATRIVMIIQWICVPIPFSIFAYRESREFSGRRKAMTWALGAFILGTIPLMGMLIGICAILMGVAFLADYFFNKWIDRDPTLPANVETPIQPEPSVQILEEPPLILEPEFISPDRFEIMDL